MFKADNSLPTPIPDNPSVPGGQNSAGNEDELEDGHWGDFIGGFWTQSLAEPPAQRSLGSTGSLGYGLIMESQDGLGWKGH